jgi:DNA-binding SARP family transcriptional activator
VIAHDSGAVELLLATGRNERPPAPFVAVPGGWQLPAAAAGYTFGVDELGDPLPALLPVGRVENAEHFHDLGHDGLVAVTGPDTEIVSFLATAAASLAGAPWAGQLQVLTPPDIAAEIGAVEHLEPVADLPAIVPHLLAVSGPHGGAASPTFPAANDSRQIFVLVGWRAAEIPPLLTAAALDPHRPVIALVRGPHPDITGTWQLNAPQLLRPGQTPTTVMLRTAAAASVPALLEHARTASPVPADDEQYEGLRQQAPPQAPPSDASDEYDEDAADGNATGPAGSHITVDGHAESQDVEAGPIQIRILGPVDVHGAPPPRRNPVLQILIYLAVHRRGVDAGQLTTALWPDAAAAGQTLRNRIGEARSVVDGHITSGPRWQLTEQIGCDWQHFQALAVGDDRQQRAALDLVRGRPFEDMADTEWIHLEGLVTEMEAAIVDLALIVAVRALNSGEPAAAFAAARAGLRASPYEERLYRLAMRAADAEGASGKIRTVMRELRTVLDTDIEPDDTIERETIDLYQQLMDSQARGASPVGD